MALVDVELLVKCQIPMNSRGMQRYDIITIQPADTLWGTGDLQGKLVFVIELDLPCGLDFMKKNRCSQCEHMGIVWEDKEPIAGTIGHPRETCPAQKYMVIDGVFEMAFDVHNIPFVKETLNKRRKYQLDYSQFTTLTPEIIFKAESETSITEEERDLRLIDARKLSNKILETAISLKV